MQTLALFTKVRQLLVPVQTYEPYFTLLMPPVTKALLLQCQEQIKLEALWILINMADEVLFEHDIVSLINFTIE
jgi:hypothetical protein